MIVTARTLGSRRPLFADWSVPLPPIGGDGDGGITLRDVISHVVAMEVKAFLERQEDRRLDRDHQVYCPGPGHRPSARLFADGHRLLDVSTLHSQ